MSLKGKIAVVTGGSRGIGRAISILLGSQGANVFVNYSRNEEMAKGTLDRILQAGGSGQTIKFDVSDFRAVEEALKKIGKVNERIDILINNAGITRDTLFVRMKPEQWNSVISVNLSGPFHCCRAVAKIMMKRRSGKIVNISSLAGEAGNPGQVNYSASKAGIIGFTKSLAKELGPWNINVNAVSPGYIKTDMTEDLPEKVKDEIGQLIPLKRFGTPEDVANAVLFLVSESSKYITGHVLNVNGGLSM